jgi:hypothetical protein
LEKSRSFKPRTLGGRIFLIMMVGGLIIAGLASMASIYVIDRSERISRAYTLGFTIRELVLIAENPELRGNARNVGALDGLHVDLLPACCYIRVRPSILPCPCAWAMLAGQRP